jgi:hypothetical protein
MTDRINGCIVYFERDIHEDDVQPYIDAIKMIKGVLRVKPHAATWDDEIGERRAKLKLQEKLWNVVKD